MRIKEAIRVSVRGLLTVMALGFLGVGYSAVAAKGPMNVIFILADDLGYSDTTLYGTTDFYQTPHLERLAARGMTFNRAYANSPLCSPTRASILTGQTAARHGSTRPEHHKGDPRLTPILESTGKPGIKTLGIQTVNRLDTALPTLGKRMKKGGYATGHFGKWHLGPEPYSPLEHGFDVDIPHTPSPGPAGSYLAPWRFAKDLRPQAKGEHIEDRMAKEAIRWMKGLPMDKPFFMNYWQFSVHAPFDAKPELIEKYKKLVDPNNRQRSPTYAAMVESGDDAVGALLDAVDEAGIADRTVIIFVSDNGGNVHQSIPADNAPVTSNYPHIGGKATIREGGVHVPCVVVWPGVTTPGSRSDEVIQTADFYPTLLENLGMGLPENYKVDGTDLMPALRGGSLDRDGVFTYFPIGMPAPDWLPASMAVYSGDWKLIRLFHGGENGAHDYRLYNVVEDLGEKNDLKKDYPEVAQRLDGLIEAHIQDANAVVPASGTGSVASANGARTRSPNVIIIYSDDHGYTDLGAYGIDENVDTPHMDRLARSGTLMTNGYSSAPQCRPSRAGLMAGRIQNEFRFSGNHADAGEGEGIMPRMYPEGTDMEGQPLLTIADRMKALGYVTGFSGKWHCGPNEDPIEQGTLRGYRTHSIDNTITLNIVGKKIAPHPRWTVDHTIINEKSGNASWYRELKAELDAHPDLEAVSDRYYVRMPRQGWKGPVEDVLFSRGKYANNGLRERYEKLSEAGVVGLGIPATLSEGAISYASEPFTQSGVQLLKFTPVP